MIQMYNVVKTYPNGAEALRGVSLEIGKGDFVFLTGPSGAGKTTLMKMIYREETPSGGHVVIDGRSIERLHPSRIPYLRRSVGVVFQDFKLVESQTVGGNVAYALRVTGTPDAEIHERVLRVLDLMGLKHKSRHFPSQLSAGEKQRTCIARALVNDPAILVTDEPTGNLDPELSVDIMRVFRDINDRGTTILVATHNPTLVDSFARRVLHLVAGKVVSDEDRQPRGTD